MDHLPKVIKKIDLNDFIGKHFSRDATSNELYKILNDPVYISKIEKLISSIFLQNYTLDVMKEMHMKIFGSIAETDDVISLSETFATFYVYVSQTISKLLLSINKNDIDNDTAILEQLYYDSGYNSETGDFTKMSDENKELFDANMNKREILDSPLKTFISKYFLQYFSNLEKTKKILVVFQSKIKKYIDMIFKYDKDDNIEIDITFSKLTDLNEDIDDDIIEMKLQCNELYLETLTIYESIVDALAVHTTTKQIEFLNQLIDDM